MSHVGAAVLRREELRGGVLQPRQRVLRRCEVLDGPPADAGVPGLTCSASFEFIHSLLPTTSLMKSDTAGRRG